MVFVLWTILDGRCVSKETDIAFPTVNLFSQYLHVNVRPPHKNTLHASRVWTWILADFCLAESHWIC